MTSYFTGGKVTKATEAYLNVEKYNRDRGHLVENYITRVITELMMRIAETSRKEGAVHLDFDYSKIGVTDDELKQYKIKFKEFSDEEHVQIRKRIIEFLTNEEFELGAEPTYISKYNRTQIKIKWN